MNPADDDTVPHKPLPTFVNPDSVHPLARALLNAPKDTGPRHRYIAPLAKDDPLVSSGVDDLEAAFAESLTPTEEAYQNQLIADRLREANRLRPNDPPKNFLQAHMIIIDQLLMNPGISTTALSTATGYSRNWLHKVMSSDAFQAKLSERQKALCDPIILNTIAARLQGIASRTLEVIEDRVDKDDLSLDNALEVFSVVGKAMGLGQQAKTPVIAQQFIVHVPPRMADASAWAQQHSGRPPETLAEPLTIDQSSLAPESDPAP